MTSSNVNIRITGKLREHMQQQIGANGLYDNASEYIRDLVRRDMQDRAQAWDTFRQMIEPALRAPEYQFFTVSADDVISRNKAKQTQP